MNADHGFLERLKGWIEDAILASRYLLLVLFLIAICLIPFIAWDCVMMLLGTPEKGALVEHMMKTLDVLDLIMLATLCWLIGAGGFYVFIDNFFPDTSGKKRPRCLFHVSTGILKEKMGGSIVGISTVYLLQIFFKVSESQGPVNVPWLVALGGIHVLFIFGFLAFNYANKADHHAHNDADKKEGASHDAKTEPAH